MNLSLQLDIIMRLLLAAVLGAVIGYNRSRHDHPAGLRTQMLIALGSALFTALSTYAWSSGDPSRIASQIVIGIGFLGAGVIVQSKETSEVHGVTTAASIWAVAALGMACGAGYYVVAVAATVMVWIILTLLLQLEGEVRTVKQQPYVQLDPAGPPRANSSQEPRNRR